MKRIILFVWVFIVFFVSCENFDEPDEKKDYRFMVNGAEIAVGARVDEVINKIGKYDALDTSPSCAIDGTDEIYIYKGFRIIAHKSENSHIISSIEITNDTVSTPEGIKIGEDENQVIKIYGDGFERQGERMIYEGATSRLSIGIRNNKVSSIRYIAK